eukprot:7548969-Pyramimonas_sp.AAC.2
MRGHKALVKPLRHWRIQLSPQYFADIVSYATLSAELTAFQVHPLGLHAAVKPLLSHSTTGEFKFSPQVYTENALYWLTRLRLRPIL